MPQLDPGSFTSQLFWLTVSFVMLYLVLARFLLPRVQSVLAFRAYTMEGDIKQAERMKADAEKAQQLYDRAILDARKRSQKLLADARETIAARAANTLAALDAKLDEDAQEAKKSIDAAKHSVLQKLTPVSEALTTMIVEMLVEHKPSAKDVTTVVADVSRERRL